LEFPILASYSVSFFGLESVSVVQLFSFSGASDKLNVFLKILADLTEARRKEVNEIWEIGMRKLKVGDEK